MTDQEILNLYRPMVHYIAQICGPACEVLLHDVAHPEASVIEIANGEKTGRTIGSPLTDFARKVMENCDYIDSDWWCNYSGASKGRNYISSTYYIKNNGHLIGMLCVNRDITETQELGRLLNHMLHQHSMVLPDSGSVQETLEDSVTAIKENMVSNAISEYSIDPERMSRDEKIEMVKRLRDQGMLEMKGAVTEIARQLHVSEPTVYRYMKR